jgi:hypothetical protein
MTDKIQRIISTICLVAAIVSVAFFPVSASCETLRFVFLADSRGDALDHPIHIEALQPIIEKIGQLNPLPAFVIFGGDMSYRGYIYDKHQHIETGYTFQQWKDLFKDLTAKGIDGIDLYTAIGNHELYRHDDKLPSDAGFFLENQEEYKKVFSENPSNGPLGYKHLVYSFNSPGGDAFFAVLDPYYLTKDIKPDGLGGRIDDVQLKWLEAQVAKTRATHKFLFIHTPYYYTGEDPEELSNADVSHTKLWTILDNNRFDLYACGHEHLYSRKTIDWRVPPNPQTTPPRPPWRHDVVQLLNGTSGAGPDLSKPFVDPKVWHIHQDKDTYYFSVIDIDGGLVKVTSYGYRVTLTNDKSGDFKVIDQFTIDQRHR